MVLNAFFKRENKYETSFIAIISIYLFLISTGITIALFAGRGAEDALNITKYTLYGVMLLTAIFVIIIIKMLRKSGSAPEWLDVIGFDPEKSPFRNIPYISRFISSPLLQFLAFFTFLLIFVLVMSSGQQSSLPDSIKQFIPETRTFITQQQVYPSASLALAIEPASSAETLTTIIFVSLLIILNTLLFKLHKSKVLFLILLLFAIPILGGLEHYIYHLFRYGATGTALIATFLFGWIESMLTVTTFSVIPAILYHEITNGVGQAFVLFSSGNVMIFLIIAIILLIILTIIVFLNTEDKKYPEKYPSTIT